MRKFYKKPLTAVASYKSLKSFSLFLLIIFLIPLTAFSQKQKDIKIYVECIYYIGGDMYEASFGYENPNKNSVIVEDGDSYIVYNKGQAKKMVTGDFLPGTHEGVEKQTFRKDDYVEWTVLLPNGKTQTARSDINSSHCSDPSLIRPLFLGERNEDIIGQELTYLNETYDSTNPPEELVYQITNDEVLIDIIPKPNSKQAVLDLLSGTYGIFEQDILDISDNGFIITTLFPIGLLAELNTYTTIIEYVRNSLTPFSNGTETQGDIIQGSFNARLGYGVSGLGARVGIFSDSFDALQKAAENVTTDDLPEIVIHQDDPDNTGEGKMVVYQDLPDGNDEGRAMAQLIYDVAPNTSMAFWQSFWTEGHMARGIRTLHSEGYNILVSDVTYPQTPWYRDGLITQAVNYVTSPERENPALYVDAAGNFGSQGIEVPFISNNRNELLWDGSNDTDLRITVSDYTYIVFQWDDDWYSDEPSELGTPSGALFDFDVILQDLDGNPLYVFGRENSDPYELVAFEALAPTEVTLSVVKVSGPRASEVPPPRIKAVAFVAGDGFSWEYDFGAGTIVGPAASENALTVAASPFFNPVTVEEFSSRGAQNPGELGFNKPDITSIDGGNVQVSGSVFIDYDPDYPNDPEIPEDETPNFFGTSAAAPLVAGVAALVREVELKGAVVGDLKTLLTRADLTDENFTAQSWEGGNGLIQADNIISTLIELKPQFIPGSVKIYPPEELSPGVITIKVDMGAEFINENATIYIEGEPVPTTQSCVDGTCTLTATLTTEPGQPLGDPIVQIYNPPSASDGRVGNFSDEFSLFDNPTVIISADINPAEDADKLFAQKNPADYEYKLLDGTIVRDDQGNFSFGLLRESLADSIRLFLLSKNLLAFTAGASDNPEEIEPGKEDPAWFYDGVNAYTITPFLEDDFYDENQTDDEILFYRNNYNFQFQNGVMV